jgi:hypothetical protein
MDADRFDALTRRLGATDSRRRVLRGTLGAALGGLLAAAGMPGDAAAQLGGLADGQPCTSGEECSSGRCKRKRGTRKKFCRHAPGQGTCIADVDACVDSPSTCNNDPSCVCFVTTRGWSVCAVSALTCVACDGDGDCEQVIGKGSRCIRCDDCLVSTGFACVRPCPTPA